MPEVKKLSEMPMWKQHRSTKEMEDYNVPQGMTIRRTRGDEIDIHAEAGMVVSDEMGIDPRRIYIYRCSECPCLCEDGCNRGDSLLASLTCASGVRCPEDPDFPPGWCDVDGSPYFEYQIDGIQLTNGLSSDCGEAGRSLILGGIPDDIAHALGPDCGKQHGFMTIDPPDSAFHQLPERACDYLYCCGGWNSGQTDGTTGAAAINPTDDPESVENFGSRTGMMRNCGWTGIYHAWPTNYDTNIQNQNKDTEHGYYSIRKHGGYGLGTLIRDFTSIIKTIEYADCGGAEPPCTGVRGAGLQNYWLHEFNIVDGEPVWEPTGSPEDTKEVELFFDLRAEIKFSCNGQVAMVGGSRDFSQQEFWPEGTEAPEMHPEYGDCNVVFTLMLHEAGRVWPESDIDVLINNAVQRQLYYGHSFETENEIRDRISEWWYSPEALGHSRNAYANNPSFTYFLDHYGGGPISQSWSWSTKTPVDGTRTSDGGYTYELFPVEATNDITDPGMGGMFSPGNVDPNRGQHNKCFHGVGESGCFEDINRLLCGPIGASHSSGNSIRATYLPMIYGTR